MKKRIIHMVLFAIVFAFTFQSCKKDKDDDSEGNKDGLTTDITDFVPQSVLDELEDLGMPIYGGDNPPDIENTYLASPFILENSNISTDNIGMMFADYYVEFSDQNNSKLTVEYSYENGPESGSGLGAFIVGENNDFSVFVELEPTAYGDTVSMLHLISGTVTEDGISDLYFANFMLDNNGNVNGYWIDNDKGRVVYDSDGFSPVVGSSELGLKKATDAKGAGSN